MDLRNMATHKKKYLYFSNFNTLDELFQNLYCQLSNFCPSLHKLETSKQCMIWQIKIKFVF